MFIKKYRGQAKNMLLSFLLLFLTGGDEAQKIKQQQVTAVTHVPGQIWSAEKAHAWYNEHKWITGVNFLPSTAINQLEMWQAESFDTARIG